MWSLKIKVREKWNIYNKRTLKYKVKLYFFSQNHYYENERFFFIGSGLIAGEEQNKKKFFSDLKKDKKVVSLEVNKDFFICIYSEKKTSNRAEAVKIAYNPRLIFLKPVIINEEGFEEWEVASIKREDLEKFVHYAEKMKNVESQLFYLKQQKLGDILIYSMVPKLTLKQKKAIELAVIHNYYGYPRKIKLKDLAKIMNVSISTFQFHLAKAEAKLIPFLEKKNLIS